MLIGFFEGLFSPVHILILALGGLCFAATVVLIVVIVRLTLRKPPQTDRNLSPELLAKENERLRKEIDRLREDQA